MSFDYRIIRRDYPCGPNNEETATVYQIYEVYYNPTGSTQEPIAPYGESLQELKEDITYMLAAFDKPVLVEKNGTLVEEGT